MRMPSSVLVVEDNETIREVLCFVLQDVGYTVYEAPDGKPALARLHESAAPLVVLLDLKMPGMDGQQVLEAVAAAQDTLATRHAYILMTANATTRLPPALADLLSRLNVAVVSKPFDVDELLETVAQAAARIA